MNESPEKSAPPGNHTLGLQDLYKAAFSQEATSESEAYSNYTLKPDNVDLTSGAIIAYSVYDSNNSSCVLDLDKGIKIDLVKVPGVEQQNGAYQCDNAILQRYLQGTSVSDNGGDQSYKIVFDQNLQKNLDDNDFNSSDSFASTESIIPKDIKCPKCPKKFMFKSDLTRHDKRKHSNKQKLTCNNCSKEFSCQQNLLYHEKSHKSEFKCNKCNKNFKKEQYFAKHMAEKHQIYTPYSCSLCPWSFLKVSELNAHRKKMHNLSFQSKTYECSKCSEIFTRKADLLQHMKTHQESPVSCQICGKHFSKASHLKMHLKVHTTDGGKMAAPFSDTDGRITVSLLDASKVVGQVLVPVQGVVGEVQDESKVLLPLDNASSDTARRKSIEKPFKCSYCSKTFAHKSSYGM